MEDLGIKLNPITKLRLFREVKKVIFAQMDSDKITPERAEEILDYVKKYVVDIETPEKAKQFYLHLGEKFRELEEIVFHFNFEEKEKFNKVFAYLLNEFILSNNTELANEIMDQIRETKDQQTYLEDLKKRYPIEFLKALEKIV